MASSQNPTIVLAPGAWHTPDCYDILAQKLNSQNWYPWCCAALEDQHGLPDIKLGIFRLGHGNIITNNSFLRPTEQVDYPTVGSEPPTKGLKDDAAATRAVLERLAGEGKKIILVVHSYGGLVGANAVKGLGEKERVAQGKTGGVVLFVYLSAFVAPLGTSINAMLGGNFLPWMRAEGDYVYSDTPEAIFYHDVEPELQKAAISKLKHHPRQAFHDATDYEPWKDIRCMYLFCDDDQALPLSIQEGMATALGPETIRFHCKTSHSPFLSQPDKVVEGLLYGAGQV